MKSDHIDFLSKILNSFEAHPSEVVHVTEALGRVLATDVRSNYTSPHQDISAIGGYAVISLEAARESAQLKIIGESRARTPFLEEISGKQAVYVYAGAVMPIGADTVLSEDEVHVDGDNIIAVGAVMKGQNVCYTGVDFQRNETLLRASTLLTARDLGLAAMMEVPWLMVRRRPKIAFFAVGNEISMIGEIKEGNKVTSTSSLIISSFIEACGAEPVNLGVAPDSEISINKLFDYADGVDLIITTGGASRGADGLIEQSLDKRPKFSEINMQLNCDTKVVFGRKNKTPVLSLSGNPISALICATLFLRPIINKMTDMRATFFKKSYAILDRDLDVNDKKMDYIFARLTETSDKRLKVLPASSYDRLLMSALAEADCLIQVDLDNCKKGDSVQMTRFVCSVVSG